ncbi:MAG: hypothetical protein IT371_19150 [Deltaproteobacteria bacterium]|nr:hypothetical protein [Deltaproteobacteria bacterium]
MRTARSPRPSARADRRNRREESTERPFCRVALVPPVLQASARDLPPPEAQSELVGDALAQLERVRQLVTNLPDLPGGDRAAVLARLAGTADDLRTLFFLDAIY